MAMPMWERRERLADAPPAGEPDRGDALLCAQAAEAALEVYTATITGLIARGARADEFDAGSARCDLEEIDGFGRSVVDRFMKVARG